MEKDIIIKNLKGGDSLPLEVNLTALVEELDTTYKLTFIYKKKFHVAIVEKSEVVNDTVELVKNWTLAPGELALLSKWAKNSDWIRGYKRDEHKFLLTKLGTWVYYVGRKETFHGLVDVIKIDETLYEVPEKYLLKY